MYDNSYDIQYGKIHDRTHGDDTWKQCMTMIMICVDGIWINMYDKNHDKQYDQVMTKRMIKQM